jgi:hypothetical protein
MYKLKATSVYEYILIGILALFGIGCGAGSVSPTASTNQGVTEPTAPGMPFSPTALLKDHVGGCYTKADTSETGAPLTVNGYMLSDIQARNVRWIKRCALPLLPGTPAEKATLAANNTWWSLREGVLDLDGYRSVRYSLCNENGSDHSRTDEPLYDCPTNIWQVGLGAGQVANYSDAEVSGAHAQTFAALDSRITETDVLAWTASLAGYPESDPVHSQILQSIGRVRRGWLLRNPVIAFLLVGKLEVIAECLIDHKSWCYGGGYSAGDHFSPNAAGVLRSISDLKSIFAQ